MTSSKYFEKTTPEILGKAQNDPQEFSVDRLKDSLSTRIKSSLFRGLVPVGFRLARILARINLSFAVLNLIGIKWIIRAVDIQEILEKPDIFKVPFGPEMTALAGGVNFALGDDGDEHARQREVMERIFRDEDLPLIAENVAFVAKGLLKDAGGEIDALEDYLVPILTLACLRYFGIKSDDPKSFAHWNLAVSLLIFADPTGNEETRNTAFAAAENLCSEIDTSIKCRASEDRTLLGRVLQLRESQESLQDGTLLSDFLANERIRSMFVGMISGNTPTLLISAGNALEVLLRRHPSAMQKLREAALLGQEGKQTVTNIVMEAARFQPAVFPGQFRHVTENAVLEGERTSNYKFKQGDIVCVATTSAVLDRRARKKPYAFRPGWPAEPDFMFGHGIHNCIGKNLAIEIMTTAFQELFRQPDIRPKHKLTWIKRLGAFPYNVKMNYQPALPSDRQTMMTIGIPMAAGQVSELRNLLETEFENPAVKPLNRALTATKLVHNMSMFVAELTYRNKPKPMLIVEINADGQVQEILEAIENAAGDLLEPVLAMSGKPRDVSTAGYLSEHIAQLQTYPWGGIGLMFNGIGEFSVEQIREEKELFSLASEIVEEYLPNLQSHGNVAKHMVEEIREYLECDPKFSQQIVKLQERGQNQAAQLVQSRLDRGKELRHLLYRPSSKTVAFADYKDVTFHQAVRSYVFSPGALFFYAMTLILVSILAYWLGDFEPRGVQNSTWLSHFVQWFTNLIVIYAIAISAFLMIATAAVWRFLHNEANDVVDDRYAAPDHIRAIEEQECRREYLQNQISAVNTLKPGFLRKLALAGAFHAIKAEVQHWFRPGFVVDIGTIRHAKWFRLPKTDQMIFQANYDGSWESYLEDFSNKAYQGQNASWGNCEGFPRTRGLILKGAQDGDRFKRWVRRRQVLTSFWYCRFPDLTNTQIRLNALIRDGLARVKTESEAREWLSYLGSRPRPSESLESEEVQSLIFRGFKRKKNSACVALHFPGGNEKLAGRKRFLKELMAESAGKPKLAFGDTGHKGSIFFVGLSADGMVKLGLPDDDANDGLRSFPPAFVQGMGGRSAILGDFHKNTHSQWDWADKWPGGSGNKTTDMIVVVMASSKPNVTIAIKKIQDCWEDGVVEKLKRIDSDLLTTTDKDAKDTPAISDKEPFGFRDGISQPVIKGTHRHALSNRTRDCLEPGEFILGYPDNKLNFPPSPFVFQRRDSKRELPDDPENLADNFANFSESRSRQKDLGRNGSYMVIRQLEQDTQAFWQQAEELADRVRVAQDNEDIDAEWIAARMVGRWKSGHPLVRFPTKASIKSEQGEKANGFLFGRDDAPGFRCPHGAHIRRSNPRDSFAPDSKAQIEISNRHRILRRGRPYKEMLGRKVKQGLLFLCFNSNIERQFEFVQQTWSSSESFHGLRGETDPLLHPGSGTDFTIPTPNGPIKLKKVQGHVSLKGGGYFFLPGRSALEYFVS